MNEKIISLIDKSGKTLYMITKETGIPYTTISMLYHQKSAVNKLSAVTAYKLSLYFNTEIGNILDDEDLLLNAEGKYKGYHYRFISENKQPKLKLHVSRKDTMIESSCSHVTKNGYKYARGFAEMDIDTYCEQRKAEKEVEETYERLLSHAQK